MKRHTLILSLFALVAMFMQGCANKRGVSTNFYNGCKEYYDSRGYYHKSCPKNNIVEYKDVEVYVKKQYKKHKELLYPHTKEKPKPLPKVYRASDY